MAPGNHYQQEGGYKEVSLAQVGWAVVAMDVVVVHY
jgi:hypothetical protein